MTVNEQLIEAIKDRFIGHGVKQREFGVIITYFTPSSATDFTNDLVEYISENYQPKTTSTDIEELEEDIRTILREVLDNGEWDIGTENYFISKINKVFAPHLSNKSELKKEEEDK